MNKLLVICPSMSRSKKIEEFLESFKNTKSEGTNLILGLDIDDEEYPNYMKLSNKYDFEIGAFKGENITQIFNEIIKDKNNYEYYMPINDDFVFQTNEWDKKLIFEIEQIRKKPGIAFGNDLFQNYYPSTSVISGDIIRTLGWLQMPLLTHLCGDIAWRIIGIECKCLYYRSDIIIQHNHFLPTNSEPDKIYQKTNSKEMYEKDNKAIEEWMNTTAKKDIEKVRNLCQMNGNV